MWVRVCRRSTSPKRPLKSLEEKYFASPFLLERPVLRYQEAQFLHDRPLFDCIRAGLSNLLTDRNQFPAQEESKFTRMFWLPALDSRFTPPSFGDITLELRAESEIKTAPGDVRSIRWMRSSGVDFLALLTQTHPTRLRLPLSLRHN